MGNSIFDDDDGGFSLSSGFDPGEKKVAPAKLPVAPPKAVNRPSLPTAKHPTLPAPSPAGKRLPSLPVAQQPVVQQPVAQQPAPPRQTGIPSRLPSLPTGGGVFTPPPTPSYNEGSRDVAHNANNGSKGYIDNDHNVDNGYSQAADDSHLAHQRAEQERQERDRLERERQEKERLEQEQLHLDRRRAREREEAHADRVRRDEENRIQERRRLAEEQSFVQENKQNAQQSAEAVSKSSKKSGKKQKATKEKKPNAFAGGRKKVLILRIVFFIVMGVFVIAGVKTTFFPTPDPTPAQVIGTVKKGLGLTKFPTEQGSGFVLGFSKVYFTVQANGSSERAKALAPYMPGPVISEQKFSQSDGSQVTDPQTVTSGPYISGVINKDDKNAVYTIAAQVNNTSWLYADVPVFYDDTKDAFVISGTPSFVPAPEQGALVGQSKGWGSDDPEVTKIFAADAKQFFPAWAKSDKEVMSPYIAPDATTAVESGLAGTMTFVNLNSVSVQPKDGLSDPSKRKARVAIQWENSLVKGTTYAQVYDLEIEKIADKWRIKSIVGGVTTESGK